MKKNWKKIFILSLVFGCLVVSSKIWSCGWSSATNSVPVWYQCPTYKETGICPDEEDKNPEEDKPEDSGPSAEEIAKAAAKKTK